MCGIAGLGNRTNRPADEALLRRMTAVLAHRGPDGEGVVVGGPAGLGHRRLAIIDLATGAQPMATPDKKIWITFNGEIYNFRDLRRELESLGHRFETTSDTEVILAAYQTWGVECLGRLRGMFAFGIWDGHRRRFLLARDRAGIKPLLYAWDGQRLLFASELKAILEEPSISREIDWAALGDYLRFLYVPSPRTIFKAIRKVPPASYLLLDLHRGPPQLHRYWHLDFVPEPDHSEADWLEGLRGQLEDAVRSHLVSDVPVGAFLSGGMDSSTVVALMARGAGRVRTFSIGFDETEFDELSYARQVASRYGTEHCEFVVKPEALEVLPRLAWQLDEPFGDASVLPTYYVSKMTRDHVTVALSGDGGDENFAGYRRYATAAALHRRLDRLPGAAAKRLLRLACRLLPPEVRGRGYLELLSADPLGRYFRMMTYQRDATLRRLLTPAAQVKIQATADAAPFRAVAAEAKAPDYVALLQTIDLQTYLPDDVLTKVDRASMLVSLEVRVPLLDHRLMEFLATMPTHLKIVGSEGKRILKRALAADLPAEVLTRRKMGFGVPLARWFRGELAAYARETLLGRPTRERGWLEPRAITTLLSEHAAGRRDHASQIWSLLCLEEWARRWLDRGTAVTGLASR